jgi:hypothetical protein
MPAPVWQPPKLKVRHGVPADRYATRRHKMATVALAKVGPAGYIHGWIHVGPQAVGAEVVHPHHGKGTVTHAGDGKVGVRFHSGAEHTFTHRPKPKSKSGHAAHFEPREESSEPAAKHTVAHGSDLLADDSGTNKLAGNVASDRGKYASADPALSVVADAQGFTGKPKLADTAGMNKAIADGDMELFRGVGAVGGTSAADINEQLRTGDAHFGLGIFGNGFYFTQSADTAGKYADGSSGSQVRVALAKGSKVIDHSDLIKEWQGWILEEGGRPGSDKYKAFNDPGRYAAARGYDAIRTTPDGATGKGEFVVLNRTALTVEKP